MPALRLYFADNNGRRSRMQFWLPDGLEVAALIARANALRGAAIGISNAVVIGAELLWENVIPGSGGVPSVLSDTRRNLVLFFKDNNGIGSWRVPSPGLLPFDISGEYVGVRLTRPAMAEFGLLQSIETAAALTASEFGNPFPSQFIVAGVDGRAI